MLLERNRSSLSRISVALIACLCLLIMKSLGAALNPVKSSLSLAFVIPSTRTMMPKYYYPFAFRPRIRQQLENHEFSNGDKAHHHDVKSKRWTRSYLHEREQERRRRGFSRVQASPILSPPFLPELPIPKTIISRMHFRFHRFFYHALQDSTSSLFHLISRFLSSTLLLFTTAYFLFPVFHSLIDQRLSSFYTKLLLPSGLLQWPMLEAVWAVTAFLISAFFYEIFNHLGYRRIDGTTDHIRKPSFWWWVNANIIMYLGGVLSLVLFAPSRVPPLQACSFGRLLGDTVLGIFLYDLCFYPIHFYLHKSRWRVVREIHAVHHDGFQQARLSSISTVTQHWSDAAAQVGINILVQNLAIGGIRKHPLSRLLHNFLVPYLLVEAHSGFDFPWMSHRLFPAVFGGPLRHEKHHQQGNGHYHQFFKYLDDFFAKRGWNNRSLLKW